MLRAILSYLFQFCPEYLVCAVEIGAVAISCDMLELLRACYFSGADQIPVYIGRADKNIPLAVIDDLDAVENSVIIGKAAAKVYHQVRHIVFLAVHIGKLIFQCVALKLL